MDCLRSFRLNRLNDVWILRSLLFLVVIYVLEETLYNTTTPLANCRLQPVIHGSEARSEPHPQKNLSLPVVTKPPGERQSSACTEHRHVAFLKVHKAGSTTVMNILQRFGEKRELICAIPRGYKVNYLGYGTTIQEKNLLKPPKGQTYNLLYNHVVYNREAFRRVMPNNTKYIAIVREPLELLDSAITYLQHRFGYIAKIPKDKLVNFLSSPAKYEPPSVANSFTNNRMAFDFGLRPRLLHNKEAIQRFLHNISQDFDFVLILEYLDESLILLKRMLCWTFEDIIYIPANVNKKRYKRVYSQDLRQQHSRWAVADVALYDLFYNRFWADVRQQDASFFREVREFKHILQIVGRFCSPNNGTSKLVVNKSEFTQEFTLDSTACNLMKLPELDFMVKTLSRHMSNLKRQDQNQ